MPSPFPGMNPYLEREGVWHGFHERMCVHCSDVLVPQVGPDYVVDLDEHVYIHELVAQERYLVGRPDAMVITAAPGARGAPSQDQIATIPAPQYTRVPSISVDEERVSFLKILDRDSNEVVSVIELLSPVNKGSGRQEYLAKRNRYLKAGIGLIEIDLLRGGKRVPLEDPPEDCDYCITVVRPNESPKIGVWALRLRDPLPIVPVPVRPGDPDARLDLGAILHHVYDAAGYKHRIYTAEPEPPLTSADLKWAIALRA